MNILIIEDEPPAMARLKKLLSEEPIEMETIWEADSVESAVHCLQSHSPEVIFSDIQLGDGTCFDAFRQKAPSCPVIFITAYDEFALKAFEHYAIDYLLKPLKKEELHRSIEKLRNLTSAGKAIDYTELARSVLEEEKRAEKRYLIRYGDHIRTLSSGDIAYVYTTSKAVFFVLHSGKEYPCDQSLETLEKELDPKKFFRINRQFIVNLQAIGPMTATTKSRVRLELQPPFRQGEVVVSTERSPLFKIWIGKK